MTVGDFNFEDGCGDDGFRLDIACVVANGFHEVGVLRDQCGELGFERVIGHIEFTEKVF
jgi:hypothetical protein